MSTTSTLSAQFGLRVRELREAAGLSQEAFAYKNGFARSYMSKIERGRANVALDAIARLAHALGVEPGELFVAGKAGSLVSRRTSFSSSSKGLTKSAVHSSSPPLVPFDRRGDCFHPGLRQVSSGEFVVGVKSARVKFKTFSESLTYLNAMKPAAKWTRPSASGNPGVVVGVEWKQLPPEFMHLLKD